MALKTPIMLLQELMVTKRQPYPDYTFESVGDSLNPQFCCLVKASTVAVVAYGRNKKEAKQQAAALALKKLQDSNPEVRTQDESDVIDIRSVCLKKAELAPIKSVNVTPPKNYVEGLNYVGQVNEYASKNNCLKAVKYEDSILPGCDKFEVKCLFGNLTTSGYSRTKKQAKQFAAFEMLELLKTSNYKPKSIPMDNVKTERSDDVDSKAIEKFHELSDTRIAPVTKSDSGDVHPLGVVIDKFDSVQEAVEKLKSLNLSHKVEVLQRVPCMVAVQIQEKPATAMAEGNNVYEATLKAMNKVLQALSEG